MDINHYDQVNADGNSRVHLGNAIYHGGPNSRFDGPAALHGNMTINLVQPEPSVGFQQYEDPLTALKRVLYYPSMETRQAQLSSVRPASFDWIWTETNFQEWLQSDTGLYWIQGKPASGKSTLIHHLATGPLVRDNYRNYFQCDESCVLVIHFYFDFRADRGVPNTPIGMLRAFLLQLICESPVIADQVLKRLVYRLNGSWLNLPEEMIQILSDALHASGLHVVGFVDGLDEYNGNISSLLDCVQSLHLQSGMKICLASRPESEIKFKLQDIPGFPVQRYNRSTIRTLLNEKAIGIRSYIQADVLRLIIDWIENHADGVILWARFACKEVETAARRGESTSEIWSRLQGYPTDLKDIYHRAWQKMNAEDRVQAAVAMYLVDNWFKEPRKYRPSQRKTYSSGTVTEIFLDDLYVRWCDIISQTDVRPMVYETISLESFTFRIENLLSDFLALIRKPNFSYLGTLLPGIHCSVVLIHKTLSNFLDECSTYNAILSDTVLRNMPPVPLGVFYSTIITKMSDHLKQHPQHQTLNGTKSPRMLHFTCFNSNHLCRIHESRCLELALLNMAHLPYMDQSEYMPDLRKAAGTWIFRQYHVLPGQLSDLPSSSILSQHTEIAMFIRHGHINTFCNWVDQNNNDITRYDWDALFKYCLIPLQGIVLSSGHDEIVSMVLEHLPPTAFYLFSCVVPVERTKHVMQINPRLAQASLDEWKIETSLWWDHSPADLLCCWAWSTLNGDFENWNEATQRFRLQVLLDRGVSLSKRVFRDGNVLHALLQFDPLEGKSFSSSSSFGSPLSHLMKVKFDILIQLGIDVNTKSKFLGRPIDVARQSLALLQRSLREGWSEIWRNIEEQSLLEQHIIPSLESRMADLTPHKVL